MDNRRGIWSVIYVTVHLLDIQMLGVFVFASNYINLGSQRILLAHSLSGVLIKGPSINQAGDVVLAIPHDQMTARCLMDRMGDVGEAKYAADKEDDRLRWDYDVVPRRASSGAPHYYYYYEIKRWNSKRAWSGPQSV